MSYNLIHDAIQLLDSQSITFEMLLSALVNDPQLRSTSCAQRVSGPAILEILATAAQTRSDTRAYMMNFVTQELQGQIVALTKRDAGYHFNADNISIEQIDLCDIGRLSAGMKSLAPDVWHIFGKLLQSNSRILSKRAWARKNKKRQRAGEQLGARATETGRETLDEESGTEESDNEMEDRTYGNEENGDRCDSVLETSVGSLENMLLHPLEQRDKKLLDIKTVKCISILMHNTNRRSNALQVMIGLFLQSCCAPDAAIDLMAHLGLSISTTTIQNAVDSLSARAEAQIRAVGSTKQTMYAYDNLDINFKHSTPTLENTHDSSIAHMSVMSEFPLNHVVNSEDLECGKHLQELLNSPPHAGMDQVLKRLDEEPDERGFFSFERFRIWKFLADLVEHGPEYFRQFRKELGEPEEVEMIPVVKTTQVPMRAAHIQPNTPATNGDVLANIFAQAGVGDPYDDKNEWGLETSENHQDPLVYSGETVDNILGVYDLDHLAAVNTLVLGDENGNRTTDKISSDSKSDSSNDGGSSAPLPLGSDSDSEVERKEDNEVIDIGNKAIIIIGDLLTGQHLRSLQKLRSIENTPFRRLSFMVYIPGLFHFKMACAEAIWKQFIGPKKAKTGTNSLLAYISQIRKNEVAKFRERPPDFRSMHEVIQHVGAVSRLDLWRQIVDEVTSGSVSNLDEWAAKKPTWEEVKNLAEKLAQEHVAPPDMGDIRRRDPRNCDQVKENLLLFQRQTLLYEETCWAMNHGDIGQLERTFLSWIHTFAGCGKHKYAAELKRYLINVHILYKEPLQRLVRYNILVNPTGKQNGFRGIDWMIEHNNLYIKKIYGGQYSNKTLERIIKMSPLIETFKSIQHRIEDMLIFNNKTTHHTSANMKTTFAKLAEYMRIERSNAFIPGRTAGHEVQDMMAVGIVRNLEVGDQEVQDEEDEEGNNEVEVQESDLLA